MGELSGEPSMEDILSSIKRIIAEEGDTMPSRSKRLDRAVPRRDDAEAHGNDEILELRESVTSAPSPTARQPLAVTAQAPPEPAATPANQPADESAATASAAEAILSKHTAEATRGPLDTLSRLVVKPEVAGSDTLEAMVREMLRPMLREWLDANLPPMVEAMVAREIDRITGK